MFNNLLNLLQGGEQAVGHAIGGAVQGVEHFFGGGGSAKTSPPNQQQSAPPASTTNMINRATGFPGPRIAPQIQPTAPIVQPNLPAPSVNQPHPSLLQQTGNIAKGIGQGVVNTAESIPVGAFNVVKNAATDISQGFPGVGAVAQNQAASNQQMSAIDAADKAAQDQYHAGKISLPRLTQLLQSNNQDRQRAQGTLNQQASTYRTPAQAAGDLANLGGLALSGGVAGAGKAAVAARAGLGVGFGAQGLANTPALIQNVNAAKTPQDKAAAITQLVANTALSGAVGAGGVHQAVKLTTNDIAPHVQAFNQNLGQVGAIGKDVNKVPQNGETPNVAQSTPQQRGFTESVKNSPEVSANVRKQVGSNYTPSSNAALVDNSNKLVGQGLDKATIKVLGNLSQTSGRVTPQHISDAIAVAKAHDYAGNFDTASQVYDKLAQHGTSAGQKVQALSLLSSRTPEGMHYSAMKTLDNAGVQLTPELTAKLQDHINEIRNTSQGSDARAIATQKLVHTVNQNLPRNAAEAGVGLWRAGLLTGPETIAKVAASHGITAPIEAAARPVTAAVDRATSLFTGKRTTTFSPADIGTALKGEGEGIKAAGIKAATGIDLPNTGGFETSMGGATHQTPYEQGVLRAHGIVFKPNYVAGYRTEIMSQARAAAMNQGLKGAEKQSFIDNFAKTPPPEAVKSANLYAEKVTNMNSTVLGEAANKLQSFAPGGVPVGKFIVPFSRIPSAIATKGIVDYTPLGLGRATVKVIQGIKSGNFDQKAFSEAVGRSAVGTTATVAVGSALAANGRVTLKAPSDTKERALWSAQGKQPNSILVDLPGGQKWISLNAFGPAGIALGLGAAFETALRQGQNPGSAAVTASAAAGRLVADQPYFKGLAGAANALNDPTRYASTFLDNTVGSFIPAMSSQIAAGTDTTQRAYPKNIVDTLKSKIPGLRETLPAQQDMFGQNLPGSNPSGSVGGGIIGTVNPFYPSAPRNATDPATQELQRLYNTQGSQGSPRFAPPTKMKIDGTNVKMNAQNLNVLQGSSGPVIHQAITNLLSNPQYQQMDDTQKTNIIDKVISSARQAAGITQAGNFSTPISTTGNSLTGKVDAATQSAINNPNDIGKNLNTTTSKTGKTTTSLVKSAKVSKAKGTSTRRSTGGVRVAKGRTAKMPKVSMGTTFGKLNNLLKSTERVPKAPKVAKASRARVKLARVSGTRSGKVRVA